MIPEKHKVFISYCFVYGDWNGITEAICYPPLTLDLPLWVDSHGLAASCEFVFLRHVSLPHKPYELLYLELSSELLCLAAWCNLGLHAWGLPVNQWPETPKLVWGVPKGCGLRRGATVWWRQSGILKWQMAYGMPWGVYLFMSLSVLRENDGDFVDVWRTPSQAGGGAWVSVVFVC